MKKNKTGCFILFLCFILHFACAQNIGKFVIKNLTQIGTLPVQPIVQTEQQNKIIQQLIQNKTSVPDGTGIFTHISLSGFSPINNDFAFGGFDADQQFGLYGSHKGNVSTIANRYTKIPGGAGYFISAQILLFDPVTNDIIFLANGALKQVGIYCYKNGGLEKIADQRTIMGTRSDLFSNFFGISSYQDTVVFVANGQSTPKGLYVYYNGSIYELISSLDTLNQQDIQDIIINENALRKNQIVFSIIFKDNTYATYHGLLYYSTV